VLVLDANPLCPTAANVTAALNGLADRLVKLGCDVVRQSPNLPDLALTTRLCREMLAAFFSFDLTPEDRERVEAAAKSLSPMPNKPNSCRYGWLDCIEGRSPSMSLLFSARLAAQRAAARY
jgi:hypothetical protein